MKNYQDAVLQKRLEEMTPEEIAQLQAKVAAQEQDFDIIFGDQNLKN